MVNTGSKTTVERTLGMLEGMRFVWYFIDKLISRIPRNISNNALIENWTRSEMHEKTQSRLKLLLWRLVATLPML